MVYKTFFFEIGCLISAIYPMTPSSPMGEYVEKIFLVTHLKVQELQSEGGAAGAAHVLLSAGAFCSTYTASQGLLFMIPNMYHSQFLVTTRMLWLYEPQVLQCYLSSSLPTGDNGLTLSHLATIRASIPFLHFFDSSHEIQKIELTDYEDIKKLLMGLQQKRQNPSNLFFWWMWVLN